MNTSDKVPDSYQWIAGMSCKELFDELGKPQKECVFKLINIEIELRLVEGLKRQRN